jgi:HK97 family phage major capsid protein
VNHIQQMAVPVVAGAAEVLGYTRNGQPIYPIAGGDGTATAVADPTTNTAKLVALLQEVRDIAAKAEEAKRELDDNERNQINAKMTEAKGLRKQIDDAAGMADLKDQIKSLGDGIKLLEPRDPIAGTGKPGAKAPTLGGQFVESEQFKAFLKRFPRGEVSDTAKNIQSDPVAFDAGDVLWPGRKATLITGASDTSAGALVFAEDLGLRAQGTFQRPLTLVDLVSRGTTESDTVSYVRVTGFTNAAAPTAEATAATGTSGTKPQSDLALERVEAPVRTIAHWMAATKRSLSDAGQVRTLIDNFLRYGLAEEVEDQIVTGDGTGEDFEGIQAVDGVQSQPYSNDYAGDGLHPLLETTRKARTKVRLVGRAIPTGYAFHPLDWEKIDLVRLAKNPQNEATELGTQRLHGLPVVESEAVPEGTGYVADWRTIVLFDREQAAIQVSDSHSDFFVRNLVAILAELRAALAIYVPEAIVEIDLTA